MVTFISSFIPSLDRDGIPFSSYRSDHSIGEVDKRQTKQEDRDVRKHRNREVETDKGGPSGVVVITLHGVEGEDDRGFIVEVDVPHGTVIDAPGARSPPP